MRLSLFIFVKFGASYKTKPDAGQNCGKVCISLVCVSLEDFGCPSLQGKRPPTALRTAAILYFGGQAANNRFLYLVTIFILDRSDVLTWGEPSCLWFRRALPVFITAGSEPPDPRFHPVFKWNESLENIQRDESITHVKQPLKDKHKTLNQTRLSVPQCCEVLDKC